MYNQGQKIKYMEDKGILTQRELTFFFNKIEDVEKGLGKDLSEFSLDEIKYALSHAKPKNEKQSKVYCSFINGYHRWVKNNDDNLFKGVEKGFYDQFVKSL